MFFRFLFTTTDSISHNAPPLRSRSPDFWPDVCEPNHTHIDPLKGFCFHSHTAKHCHCSHVAHAGLSLCVVLDYPVWNGLFSCLCVLPSLFYCLGFFWLYDCLLDYVMCLALFAQFAWSYYLEVPDHVFCLPISVALPDFNTLHPASTFCLTAVSWHYLEICSDRNSTYLQPSVLESFSPFWSFCVHSCRC